MASLTDLQRQRDGLVSRIAALTSRVSFGDRTVQYDLTQAKTALDILDREIAKAGAGPVHRAFRFAPRSGY